MTEELWRPIDGYRYYEVSNRGEVRSLDRPATGSHGSTRTVRGRILAQSGGPNGYPVVTLTDPDSRRVVAFVHHLVAGAFIGPRPTGRFVLHYDDVKTNNAASNLRYGTRVENQLDSVRTGRHYEATKDACDRGHDFDSANTYWSKSGKRYCRACRRTRQAAYRQRKEAS